MQNSDQTNQSVIDRVDEPLHEVNDRSKASDPDMTRCRYCGKDTVTGSFCCEGCRKSFEAFEERMQRQGRLFLLCIVASVIVPMAIMFMTDPDSFIALPLMLIFLGLTIAVFPFCTPETVESFSFRTSVKIGRGLGAVMVVIGLALLPFCTDAF